jgi:HD-like signal output (HDOD) protein
MPIGNNLRARALKAADSLPVVAGVLQETIGLYSQHDDLSITKLAGSIERDVVIAGSVLAIANSAMYGGNNTISNLRQAIARIGMNKTRNVLLGLSLTRGFRKVKIHGTWTLARFNAHSLAAATLSDLIVRKARSTDPEWAFLSGLLHDIGLLIIAVGLPEEFATLMAHTGGDATLIEQERALLGFTHFELGAEMISKWNCPQAAQQAARTCQLSSVDLEQPLALGAVVKSATTIADSQGISNFNSVQDRDITGELLEALRIAQPVEFMEEFRTDYNDLQRCSA